MEKIKELFGFTCPNRKVYEFKPGVTTIEVQSPLDFTEWCKQFNIGRLHGKTIVHFG